MDNYTLAQQGWQCPICKKVYSPSTPWCYYCGGESKISTKYIGTSEVSLDCWENNPILLTSNPPKLVWKCRYCGKEITTEVSEIPTTICNCLKEDISKYLNRYYEISKIIDEFDDAPDVHCGRGDTNDLALKCFERILDVFKE